MACQNTCLHQWDSIRWDSISIQLFSIFSSWPQTFPLCCQVMWKQVPPLPFTVPWLITNTNILHSFITFIRSKSYSDVMYYENVYIRVRCYSCRTGFLVVREIPLFLNFSWDCFICSLYRCSGFRTQILVISLFVAGFRSLWNILCILSSLDNSTVYHTSLAVIDYGCLGCVIHDLFCLRRTTTSLELGNFAYSVGLWTTTWIGVMGSTSTAGTGFRLLRRRGARAGCRILQQRKLGHQCLHF